MVQDCPHSKDNHVSFLIRYMQSLMEWNDALKVTSTHVVFPFLEELTIKCCSQLSSVSCHFPFLQKLMIYDIDNNATLERISSNLTTLKTTQISNVLGLTFVLEQLFCTSPQSLMIENCGELSYVLGTSQPLISLKELTIYGCLELKSYPCIHVLRSLSISSCGFEVLTTQLQLCMSLSHLHINDCRNLKSILDLGELCFLTELGVCSNITRLPEGSLKCLKSMEIGGYCEELDVFPSLNFIQHSHTMLEVL